MKTKIEYITGAASAKLWLSSNDTYNWANKPGACWPCSQLSGRRLFAEFDARGLVDFQIEGGRGSQDCDSAELNAITSDFLRPVLRPDHPAYFVAVGQFEPAAK